MLKWIDNYEGYVLPSSAAVTTPMLRNYSVRGANGIIVNTVAATPENRVVAQVVLSNTALTLPLRELWDGVGPLFVGQRLVNFSITNQASSRVGQFGLAHVQGSTYNGLLLKVGVVNKDQLNIAWVENGVVRSQDVFLVQPLFGTSDYLEVKLTPGIAGSLGQLAVWVNNRVVFDFPCVPGGYSASDLHWVCCGSLFSLNPGTSSTYVQSGLSGATTFSQVSVTDLYIVDTEPGLNTDRLGRIRVTSRGPTGDIGPNEWTPYPGSTETDHADIVGIVPPDPAKYVGASGEAQTELYGATAFPALGSEQVVGMMTRVLANKVDPLGSDVRAVVKSGSAEALGSAKLLTADLSYANDVFEVNPATGSRWTASEANNSRFGFVSETAE